MNLAKQESFGSVALIYYVMMVEAWIFEFAGVKTFKINWSYK